MTLGNVVKLRHKAKKGIKKALLFTFAMMPIAIIATIFTVLYQLDMYDESIKEQLVAQLGNMEIIF